MALPLDSYLATLRKATPDNHPWSKKPTGTPALGDAFARLSVALSDFIDAAREEGSIGYEEARNTAQAMTDYLPQREQPSPADLLTSLVLAVRSAK